VDGGAISTIALGSKIIPPQTIISSGMIRVVTAVTSAGAPTVAFQLLSAEDVLAETLKASLTLDLLVDTVPVGTAATSILTTAATQLSIVIGTAVLTAGKIHVALYGSRSITA
jgi:hypothetical protein